MRNTLLIAASFLILATSSFAQTAPAAPPKLLPGTHVSVMSTIKGNAVNSANSPLPDSVVRLRDARSGRIVETVTTDKQGTFVFHNVDPGTYVVELMNSGNNTVLAASPIVYVGSGDTASALVKLPFRLPTYAGALGTSSTASTVSSAIQAIVAAAAASNTVAETLAGAPATVTNAANGR
ncbi:MAG TPA: prealbumin-like fold domain-containing protein [Vicinamibacterales bacterium]|nr:prealbumin-like fold domain-containing protein [Vicinamibacterales bacterium]